MRVYISGKIGGEVISDATRQKFARAEEMLKAKGYQVFNPCDERWQKILRREYEHDSYVKAHGSQTSSPTSTHIASCAT